MTTYTYNPATMWLNFEQAQLAVRRVDHDLMVAWHTAPTRDEAIAIDNKREERRWLSREIQRYPLHPVIEAAVMLARPYDWHQLFLEWPHKSQGDASKIAYTQNEDKGRRDIQTVTSIGKYLTRHFAMPDHTIRDLVARHGTSSEFKFVHTTAEMIYHLHRGPGSCMVWGDDRGIRCTDGVTRHPYEAYNPKYGWHMAVRIEGDDTIGRALCMDSPDHGKYYVRTYAKSPNGGYSQADNGMENWLQDQGYNKFTSWANGEKLAYHATSDDFLAPYLDGNDKRVRVDGGCLVLDDEGGYICDQTGGCPTDEVDDEDHFDCDDCGDRTSNDDGYWTGLHEDNHVCSNCCDNDYVYAYGRRGNQYYVHQNDAVYVESQSEHYHSDYLDDNEIVELNNGEYESLDEAVEVDGDWYHIDDERICHTEDTDEFLMRDDCWQCTESGNWYTEDCIDWTEYEGERYHDDHIPQHIADATADKDDAEDDGDTAVVEQVFVTPKLTMDAINACALVEDRSRTDGYVEFSISLLHNGKRLTSRRLISHTTIEQVGWDAVRMHCRADISAYLLVLANSTTETI